jgi:hypothetical protein
MVNKIVLKYVLLSWLNGSLGSFKRCSFELAQWIHQEVSKYVLLS